MASPSIFGSSAIITSLTSSPSKRLSRPGIRRSAGPTLAIGLIAPPSTWYRPWYSRVRSMLITSLGSSTTQITERSRLGSAHTGQGLDSHTLPQISQKRILALTSSMASAKSRASSSGADSM